QRFYALFAKTNSTVPTYADEFVFAKSSLIFDSLPACRQICLHAEPEQMLRLFLYRKIVKKYTIYIDSLAQL
ncbi:MAG: hypothetical protein IJH94_05255, partial [Clostridia bacterium]|nr:hypothetical protein [Clostridia bacterium]